VVVSAMGKTTDGLLEQARQVAKAPPRRELDMLLTCGERASMALLAMALDDVGVRCISFTGSQSGIMTSDRHSDARILEVRPYRVQDELDDGKVVIVAGFQGVSYRREITTLGRGGSDTTAVALAAALDAVSCEIYSDVDGVFTADPRVVPQATKLEELGYEEMQELAEGGAKVLNAQAVQFAKARGIAIYARKTGDAGLGTVVRKGASPPAGGVRGIAHKGRLFSLLAHDIDNAEALLAHLELHQLRPGQLFGQAREGAAGAGGLFCLVSPDDAHGHEQCFATLPSGCERGADRAAVSLVGEGLLESGRVLQALLSVLREEQIPCHGLSTSSFRATALVDSERCDDAVRALHRHFLEHERHEAAADTPPL
ncbi:MAG: aspartate kinase, partial [Myxococcota bacterium]